MKERNTNFNKRSINTLDLEQFKSAVENSSDHIVITDPEGTILYANKAASEITGFSVEEMVGKKAGDKTLWGGNMDRDFYTTMWETIKIKKRSFEGEVVNKRKSGEFYSSLLKIAPSLDEKGNVEMFIANEIDISPYKEIERLKKELDMFFDISLDVLCIFDTLGYFHKTSSSLTELLGWEMSDLSSKKYEDMIHEDDKESVEQFIENLKNKKTVSNFKARFLRKSGDYVWLSWNAIPVSDEKVYAIARDVTKEQAVDRMKTEFISLASHQLRTPLSAIKWFSEMLLDGDGGELNEKQLKMMGYIYDSNKRMIDLVELLLSISRIESGKINYDPEPTNLATMIEDILRELTDKIGQKKHKVTKDLNGNFEKVLVDPNLIRQVYLNLISNAVKYTNEEGDIKIKISYSDDGETIWSSVEDNGFGISEEEKAKLFTKFFRSQNAQEKDPDGNGLGLYLVKSIIESAGGQIWVESKTGSGTEFFFTIPISKPHNSQEQDG